MIKVFHYLSDLVNFKTVSNQENIQLIDYLDSFLKDLGFDTVKLEHPKDRKRANLLCQIGPKKAGGLMLSGHTDIVPTEGQIWQSDPFTLRADGEYFFGRGTTDMKGFIAASMQALSEINFTKLKRPLSLLWTYDEEVGCQGSQVAAPLLKQHFDFLPKAAIIGEPTDFQIFRMHAGHVSVRLDVRGKGAHSSAPSLGISALKAMNQILTGIYKLEEELSHEKSLTNFFHRPYVCLNVGQLNGGSAVNIIPDFATAKIGFRPLPDTNIDQILDRLKQTAQNYCHVDGANFEFHLENCSMPMMTEENSRLEQIIRPYANKSSQSSAAFCTDAGNISKQGIECLVFGPGSINIAHQANEWIKKSDLEQAVFKIKGIVQDYCENE